MRREDRSFIPIIEELVKGFTELICKGSIDGKRMKNSPVIETVSRRFSL